MKVVILGESIEFSQDPTSTDHDRVPNRVKFVLTAENRAGLFISLRSLHD